MVLRLSQKTASPLVAVLLVFGDADLAGLLEKLRAQEQEQPDLRKQERDWCKRRGNRAADSRVFRNETD